MHIQILNLRTRKLLYDYVHDQTRDKTLLNNTINRCISELKDAQQDTNNNSRDH